MCVRWFLIEFILVMLVGQVTGTHKFCAGSEVRSLKITGTERKGEGVEKEGMLCSIVSEVCSLVCYNTITSFQTLVA